MYHDKDPPDILTLMALELDHDTESVTSTIEPPMFQVVILNDDFTPMDFVMHVLMQVFDHPVAKAMSITMAVHEQGKGVVGIYGQTVAKAKIKKVHTMAEAEGHPLRLEMEPHSPGSKPKMSR